VGLCEVCTAAKRGHCRQSSSSASILPSAVAPLLHWGRGQQGKGAEGWARLHGAGSSQCRECRGSLPSAPFCPPLCNLLFLPLLLKVLLCLLHFKMHRGGGCLYSHPTTTHASIGRCSCGTLR